ncbi:MAG: MFS transporter [Phycisphaerales bacterium]|nr:MFS transporter [Phycisphaerales bacterium]
MASALSPNALSDSQRKLLFGTCFVALIATSFGFMVRIALLNDVWKPQFNLSDTQVGEIFGAGLWPFAISIVLFSLIIDKIGYKVSLWFAVVCHVIQAFMLMTPGAGFVPEDLQGYWWIWIGSFFGALGNGTVEAVINPVIASVYHKQKTKWLTILHAGWPGGLVLAGLLTLALGSSSPTLQVAVLLFPVVIYAFMLVGTVFPINERVAAGVPYTTMLRQAGVLGAFIVVGLIVVEFGRVIGMEQDGVNFWILALVMIFGFGIGGGLGRPLFILLLLLMIPLAITELGTDSWIKDLIGPALDDAFGLPGIWVLIYTAFIMMLLRLFAIGPLSRVFSPLVILAGSSVFAAAGIFLLAGADAAFMILIFATIYGIGQTFFWPCTLGLVSEQFPEGGALTLNSIAGVGMLGVGIIGTPFLGNLQDSQIHTSLQESPAIYQQYVDTEADPKKSIFGTYRAVDQDKVKALNDEVSKLDRMKAAIDAGEQDVLYSPQDADRHAMLLEKKGTLDDLVVDAKGNALRAASGPPVFMFLCYVVLILWFASRGGYKPVELES